MITVHMVHHVVKRITIQHILYFLAFITFGIGDALTGAELMSTRGIYSESNLLFRYLFATEGAAGFIAVKIWLTLCLLIVVCFLSIHGKNYWSVNGLLSALIIGGFMAIQANMRAIGSVSTMNTGNILIIYLVTALILIEAGDMVDSSIANRSKNDPLLEQSSDRKNKPVHSQVEQCHARPLPSVTSQVYEEK